MDADAATNQTLAVSSETIAVSGLFYYSSSVVVKTDVVSAVISSVAMVITIAVNGLSGSSFSPAYAVTTITVAANQKVGGVIAAHSFCGIFCNIFHIVNIGGAYGRHRQVTRTN